MARIICPYCLNSQTFTRNNICEHCNQEVPPKYINSAKKRVPVWLVTVGNKQHGKTTYVDSMAVTVENLGKIAEGTYYSYLDTYTFDQIRQMRQEVQKGILPESTQSLETPQPLLINIHNFLGHEVNTLAIFDLAGEIFDNRSEIGRYATAIRHAQTIWFLVSLDDLIKDQEGRSISDLFEVYLAGMEQLGASIRGRNVLIVYTKADKLAQILPDEIRNYLRHDPYCNLKQMKRQEAAAHLLDDYAYEQEMRRVSDALEDFTYNDVEGGIALINMIKSSGMNLSFAITSSLGQDAAGRQMGTEIQRYRVLDPLIWALTLDRGSKHETEVAILMDAGDGCETIYQNDLPAQVYDELLMRGADATSYYMGQSQPAYQLGQRPTEGFPRRSGIRLIGPILDQLPKQVFAIALTTGPIMDLYDFFGTTWYDRLLVVNLSSEMTHWPHIMPFEVGQHDPQDLVNTLFQLINSKE